ncbi:MAG: putative lipid II flippase FtsW [Deltaproteobacteria bacterium]|jgi:cell division protein FtsW|nr:putative lipid II flippase FtsW [Deltaproteobacteria bacterium]MBW2486643.1 putative lipid II flippase FtsW [Deltaproteobacteria bacterium]MBW2516586.1 putative lipid II flippase FtsW [Deltaproteobacteria bacterium]
MAKKHPHTRSAYYDVQLLFPVLFLVGIGVVMVYSASSTLALKKFGSDFFFLKKQALFALAGALVLVAGRHFPYRYYRLLAYPLVAISLALLVLIHFTDFGLTAGGATRWIRLGTFSFQPSEFARIALVIYLAYSMEKKADQIKQFSIGFLPHVLVLGVFVALIFIQPDFGTVFIFGALTWIMLFIGGVRFSQLFATMLVILPVAYLFLINAEYRAKRILGFLNPWEHSSDEGYQIVHSLMAFGTGGLWGTGIGKGYQKLFYLPEPHTDFIFSVIGEELGLLGVVIIIGLYAWIVIRGVAIARSAPDLFGAYLAVGLTIAMGLQIVVNMGVALGLLPTKGLTLPLLSYGGTSLLLNMASIGILMNISAASRS